jgi:hypothetical protein
MHMERMRGKNRSAKFRDLAVLGGSERNVR